MSSEKTEADVAFIRALAALLEDSDLGEIEVEREYGDDDALKVRLSRVSSVSAPVSAPMQQVYQPAPAAPAAPAPAATPAEAPAAPATDSQGVVPSPMVGTVYLAPEPGAPPFVSVGDSVTEGQTVLIIEAMKTMNQIASPRAGVLKAILVADGEPVEFGSPLLVIE